MFAEKSEYSLTFSQKYGVLKCPHFHKKAKAKQGLLKIPYFCQKAKGIALLLVKNREFEISSFCKNAKGIALLCVQNRDS